jgi:hypothetical protein
MKLRHLNYFAIIIVLLGTSINAFSQETKAGTSKISTLGLEIQAYPAGLISQVRIGFRASPKSEILGSLGYNLARRQDFGEHDNEEGGGFGYAFAYKQYFKEGLKAWFIEAQTSFWHMDIDWTDNSPANSGTTAITVFQPTIGFGYDFQLKGDRLKLGLKAAFGYEININTKGEDVGEGGISLFGATFSYNFN